MVAVLFNSLYNILDTAVAKARRACDTFFVRCITYPRGIKIGAGSVFAGMAKFKKANTASIYIGKKCAFNSTPTSNLIGVDRPCILAALAPGAAIKINDGSRFSGTVIGCFKNVSIGKNVRCGANTLISDGDWHQNDPRAGQPASIIIGDNVWLGVNVTVLKGVTIGENSVIGAGSVVVKDIPSNCIAAGNPCKVIRSLDK